MMTKQGTPGFRTHAGRIMNVFQEAISSLSNENYVEELEEIWNKIGESHNRRKISRQSFEVNFLVNNIFLSNSNVSFLIMHIYSVQ